MTERRYGMDLLDLVEQWDEWVREIGMTSAKLLAEVDQLRASGRDLPPDESAIFELACDFLESEIRADERMNADATVEAMRKILASCPDPETLYITRKVPDDKLHDVMRALPATAADLSAILGREVTELDAAQSVQMMAQDPDIMNAMLESRKNRDAARRRRQP
jgi:hypothetical protein